MSVNTAVLVPTIASDSSIVTVSPWPSSGRSSASPVVGDRLGELAQIALLRAIHEDLIAASGWLADHEVPVECRLNVVGEHLRHTRRAAPRRARPERILGGA